MYSDDELKGREDASKASRALTESLLEFVRPLLITLDEHLDKRLVRTFFGLLSTILVFRERGFGLILSELGGYLLGFNRAPAGTKRISNLLRSSKWSHELVENHLLDHSGELITQAHQASQDAVMLWDDSVLEKTESIRIEGLCPVRSSKGHRITRPKDGYFLKFGRPAFVPGMQWLACALVTGKKCHLTLMRWWTSRGPRRSEKRWEHDDALDLIAGRFGREVVHVFDRGYAGERWIRQLQSHRLRWIMRWDKNYKLVNAQGREDKAWRLCQGKRSLAHRRIRDAWRDEEREIGLYQIPVTHPHMPEVPLYLVVSRQGKGRAPWYLLTNEPIRNHSDGWKTIFRYAKRWYVEQIFRVSKAEFAVESPRLWFWENRLKLLSILSLVIAFLFEGLRWTAMVSWLLRQWCHRTGERCRNTSTPLYRLRWAISRLWTYHPPPRVALPWESSG